MTDVDRIEKLEARVKALEDELAKSLSGGVFPHKSRILQDIQKKLIELEKKIRG